MVEWEESVQVPSDMCEKENEEDEVTNAAEGAGDKFWVVGERQSFSGKEVFGSCGDDASDWLEKDEVKLTSPELT